jgi:hypothetical protein
LEPRPVSFIARDAAGRAYRIDVTRVPPRPGEAAGPGVAILRFNGQPVERLARGAYCIRSGFSPSGLDTPLTSDDPDAP